MTIQKRKIKRTFILVSTILMTACSSLPNAKSVVVDKYKMDYAIQGKASPVVVLESGFGTTMENWSKVFSEIAMFSTAFAYNRRGYSKHQEDVEESSTIKDIVVTVGEVALETAAPAASIAVNVVTTANTVVKTQGKEERVGFRTAVQAVEELRTLLAETGMEPPYLLVGHSLGGLYMLYYAKTYPHEVAGVVLVDSSHPEQLQRCRERYDDEACDVPWLMKSIMKVLPDEILGEFHGREETGRQVIAAGPLPSMPLVVISQGKVDGMGFAPIMAMWPEFQQELAAQLPNTKHIIAEKSGHFIQKDQPELVVEAIKEIVISIREKAEK